MEWEMGKERERRRASDGSRPTLTLAQQPGPCVCRILRETAEWTEKKELGTEKRALQDGWANYEASRRGAERKRKRNDGEKDRFIALR